MIQKRVEQLRLKIRLRINKLWSKGRSEKPAPGKESSLPEAELPTVRLMNLITGKTFQGIVVPVTLAQSLVNQLKITVR
jgi:hypothetical protein